MEGYSAQLPYEPQATAGGAVEIDPNTLSDLAIDCLDEMHRQVHKSGFTVAAVAGSAFWHCFCGVARDGSPTLPILHLLDTRSATETWRVPNTHARTGCVPHASYWPAKLFWLERNFPEKFHATDRWLSFPEYLFLKLFGRASVSTSMASATGLWNQQAGGYDDETLAALPVRRDQLADPAAMDQPLKELLPRYKRMWPAFDGVPWLPAIGDGAANHIGSGCLRPTTFSLMVGTTGAMRVMTGGSPAEIPPGLWCYRLDRKRSVMGGALSNGGDVYSWMKKSLQLPKDVEARLDKAAPGSHGLAVLPYLSGERSPYWRADLRAAITGLSLSTEPIDILRAALESVALGFREIYDILSASAGIPQEIIASGGALLKSPSWTQMMADALGRPITAGTEQEASARGAAIFALEAIGAIANLDALPASTGAIFQPGAEAVPVFERMLGTRRALVNKLYGGQA